MDTLPDMRSAQLYLLMAPHSISRQMMTDLAVRLALVSPARVLDGGNCFNLYGVARALRGQASTPTLPLDRIHIARAFTCYQMVTLLADTRATPVPTLVLELLSTFSDENVSLPERTRLLRSCLRHLRRLSRQSPVAVSVQPPSTTEINPLYAMLKDAADQVWQLELPTPPAQPRLF
jgi:hypothetical protein